MTDTLDVEIQRRLSLPEERQVLSTTAWAERAAALPPGTWHTTGVAGCGVARAACQLLARGARQVVYVARDSVAAARAQEDVEYCLAESGIEARVLLLPGAELDPYQQVQPERQSTMARLAALSQLTSSEVQPPTLVIVNSAALVRRVVPHSVVVAASLSLKVEAEVDLGRVAEDLTSVGYLRTPIVEDPGSFSIRGSLLDVWAPGESHPVRVELFGDWIEAIRRFDADSQRTQVEVREVHLPPVREIVAREEYSSRAKVELQRLCDDCNYPSRKTRALIEELVGGSRVLGVAGYLPAFYPLGTIWDYLSKDAVLMFADGPKTLANLKSDWERSVDTVQQIADEPHFPTEQFFINPNELDSMLEARRRFILGQSIVKGDQVGALAWLEESSGEVASLNQHSHEDLERAVKLARTSRGKTAALDPLLERLAAWDDAGLNVTAVARTTTQARRLASLLRHRDVAFSLDISEEVELEIDPSRDHSPATVRFRIEVGTLATGHIAVADGSVLLTEEEIFGHRAHQAPQKRKSKSRAALEDLRALAAGDLVVHVEHGIGRYVGLENRPGPGGISLELLVVEYGGGRLYLPVYRLNQIQKYSGADKPRLDRLGGQSFAKTKAKAKRKAREMADELLRLYADRKNIERSGLPPVDEEYAAFETSFPYEETQDQAAAIADVMQDLGTPQVMDRLVCGDVGFGKTEVALRAAFRVASAGRQVAVLCPTTVLAQQHFLTFAKRLADYPLEVRVLSRFQGNKESQQTLEGLKRGTVDIVVGTHRLLSKDVQFKELGLLVVDEEQRFGVTHKERLKHLRTSIDVLTLTATPIPRTLQLAIGGLRQMSIIQTPPVNRRSIRTIVARPDDNVIKEAVERELSRGGQVYYVYNRVEGLYERANRLQTLVPNARIGVGHGQLRGTTLERTMLDFVEGEYDVLVATSIVESGLDIPRANTMVIDRADLFGLAQLYQLRGRVGRSQERAYCYLLVPPASEMSDESRARIEALERYSELGSGFQVAALDMEIRGVGDLLGADQSGAVASVGIDLFCRMLDEATTELRGETVVHHIDPELNFDIEALLPDSYISEVGVRLSMYKRLASAEDEADVVQLGAEMEDRFGAAPREVQNFVELMRLKTELRRLRVTACDASKGTVTLRLRDDTPINPTRLLDLVQRDKSRYRLAPDGRITRRLVDGAEPADSLSLAEKMLSELQETLE